jgi:hypothetical protein
MIVTPVVLKDLFYRKNNLFVNLNIFIFDDYDFIFNNETLKSSTFQICNFLKKIKTLKIFFNSNKFDYQKNEFKFVFLNNFLEFF